jgi:hypothetical protein
VNPPRQLGALRAVNCGFLSQRYTIFVTSGRKVRRRVIARWGCFVLGSYPV